MSMYGVGAYFDGNADVSSDFISQGVVGTGWDKADAPELYQYFETLKVGDVVYIKAAAFGAPEITVKAIGLVRNSDLVYNVPISSSTTVMSIARRVLWLDKTSFKIPKPIEKNNVRSNTVYEEFHQEVQGVLMARIAAIVK